MPFKKIIFFALLLLVRWGYSQIPELSARSQISVLTCGAGEDLYTTFGHSAFRVHDPSLGIDVVYNYGTFDFNPPMFYVDFARGNMIYSLSRAHFDDFLFEYEMQNRWVKEQILDLTPKESNELFQFLETNYLPENRDYKYDFLFDNCATRILAVLKKVYGEGLEFQDDYLDNQYTFRELIHQNLVANSWSSLGIDLALGSVIDKKATPYQHAFLPNYVFKQLNNSFLDNYPLVQKEVVLLDSKPMNTGSNFLWTPLFWILLLFVFVMLRTVLDFKNSVRSRRMDFFLFLITGLVGLLIFFLWFFTNHSTTANNFNILWAFPFNLVAAIYIFRKNILPLWMNYYLWGLLGLLGLTSVLWIFKIQIFSPLIIPLLIVLAVRYVYLLKCPNRESNMQ
ncbi:DUF4105 domain-containing protein [Flavobacteriaceae bacterium F89]|uniref:DUF4105 domain-containing protein n=1 Tax=Cerina litoralis TaxID=2874477 RepID=A0AAE3EY94_9FLAO|nr:DUF4105 domain-containing protein [Cerina litoralis]MCG2461932.1 DUF4105 domain-containing protein [Cerina litoralis]